jgi:hypothetical protein
MSLGGVGEGSSCGLVREQLVHVPLFQAGLPSQSVYSQDLMRAAIAACTKGRFIHSLFLF